jgi:predicted TIM-barrel fold metal-dependent hydrolase
MALRTGVGFAAAPSTLKTAVNFHIPRGACDCHVHSFDPARLPYLPQRPFTPPPATVDDLRELLHQLHLDRVVIVQPLFYGTNNSYLMDAIRQLGPNARALAIIDKATPRTALEEMATGGFRGVRLNFETSGVADPDAIKARIDAVIPDCGDIDSSAARSALEHRAYTPLNHRTFSQWTSRWGGTQHESGSASFGITEQMRGLNWYLHFYSQPSVIAKLKDHLAQQPLPVVIDHFGGARAAQGPDQQGFDAVVDLVRTGRAYVKISGANRISQKEPDFSDAAPLAQALVNANPDRILWGTDWPHLNPAYGRGKPLTEISPPLPIDDGLVLNQLARWVPDPAIRKKILVDNPARLYGFESLPG